MKSDHKEGNSNQKTKILPDIPGSLEKSFDAITLLLQQIEEQYDIQYDDILEHLKEKKKEQEKENIPVEIFSNRKLGVLESLVKYLKENKRKSLSEISGTIQRDQRTIWATYNSATKKKESLLIPEETIHNIPLAIFSNRLLGPSESLVVFLREHARLRFSIISRILNRDPRTIWATYNHAKAKYEKASQEGER